MLQTPQIMAQGKAAKKNQKRKQKREQRRMAAAPHIPHSPPDQTMCVSAWVAETISWDKGQDLLYEKIRQTIALGRDKDGCGPSEAPVWWHTTTTYNLMPSQHPEISRAPLNPLNSEKVASIISQIINNLQSTSETPTMAASIIVGIEPYASQLATKLAEAAKDSQLHRETIFLIRVREIRMWLMRAIGYTPTPSEAFKDVIDEHIKHVQDLVQNGLEEDECGLSPYEGDKNYPNVRMTKTDFLKKVKEGNDLEVKLCNYMFNGPFAKGLPEQPPHFPLMGEFEVESAQGSTQPPSIKTLLDTLGARMDEINEVVHDISVAEVLETLLWIGPRLPDAEEELRKVNLDECLDGRKALFRIWGRSYWEVMAHRYINAIIFYTAHLLKISDGDLKDAALEDSKVKRMMSEKINQERGSFRRRVVSPPGKKDHEYILSVKNFEKDVLKAKFEGWFNFAERNGAIVPRDAFNSLKQDNALMKDQIASLQREVMEIKNSSKTQ